MTAACIIKPQRQHYYNPNEVASYSPPLGASQPQQTLLIAVARVRTLSQALTESGITRGEHDIWMQESTYREWFIDARENAVDHVEAVAWRVAIGRKTAIRWKGDVVGHQRAPSENMLKFLLSSYRPEIYDRAAVATAGLAVAVGVAAACRRAANALPDRPRALPVIEAQIVPSDAREKASFEPEF